MASCLSHWCNNAWNKVRNICRQLKERQQQGDERTGSNTCRTRPAPGAAGRNGKPLKPNSVHGNRSQKLREAIKKTSSLASAAGKLTDVSEQLVTKFEKENGNMNVFTELRKVMDLKAK